MEAPEPTNCRVEGATIFSMVALGWIGLPGSRETIFSMAVRTATSYREGPATTHCGVDLVMIL